MLFSCGRNEQQEKPKKETNLTTTSKVATDTLNTKSSNETITVNSPLENINKSTGTLNKHKDSHQKNVEQKNTSIIVSPAQKELEKIINSPLRNLLSNGQLGKSFTKKELIEHYKFPKEAVSLVNSVTCVGPNQLYFKWGSTWFTEKISDAKFKNDTLLFTFKHNKTYISGGAIGIKYNKKIYTDLILANGAAYIPTVKGFHWDIAK